MLVSRDIRDGHERGGGVRKKEVWLKQCVWQHQDMLFILWTWLKIKCLFVYLYLCPPWEWRTLGLILVFFQSSHTIDLAQKWLPYLVPDVIGLVLGLVGQVSRQCVKVRQQIWWAAVFSVWQGVQSWDWASRPWDTLCVLLVHQAA